MSRVKPEFSRPLAVDRVPRGGSDEKIAADQDELKTLAARLGVPALHSVRADLRLTPWRGGLKIDGNITAEIEQISVVSLEAFRQQIEFPLTRYFLPAGAAREDVEAEVDTIEGGRIDLGEVAAETLALELDPYPRRPGEAFDEETWADADPPASPFAGLARLKSK